MKTVITILASLLLWCGCSSVEGPSVSLVNVRFTQATALETTAVFTLRLNNEQPSAVKFSGGIHKIYLNGLFVGEGLEDQAVEVPRLGSMTHEVTVHMSNLALATRIKAILEAKSFDYRIKSVFHGITPSGKWRSTSEGKLDLKDFQPTPAPASVPTPPAAPASEPK